MKALPFDQTIFLLLLVAGAAGCGVTGSEERAPELSYKTNGSGCANLMVYVENAARTEVLVVDADRDSLQLTTVPQTFIIEEKAGLLDLYIDLYRQPRNNTEYCSDIMMPGANHLQERWRAIAGSVSISISDADLPFNTPYKANVRLSNIIFVDPTGARSVTLGSLAIDSVTVGWLPG